MGGRGERERGGRGGREERMKRWKEGGRERGRGIEGEGAIG